MRWSAVLWACVLTACVKPAPEKHDGKAEAERLKEFVLEAPPADIGAHLDVDFSGKLTLLGARVEPMTGLKPGAPSDTPRFANPWLALLLLLLSLAAVAVLVCYAG